MSKKKKVQLNKKDITVFIAIVLLMISGLIYGFSVVKKNEPVPTPTFEPGTQACWDYYEEISGEQAMEMCSKYGE